MPHKKLFLSHYSFHAAEIAELANELRLRGIVPWVDKDGGFSVGDHSATEARRAIREDCQGFLLYATHDVFTREFIVGTEIPAAREAKEADDSFLLLAVPRGISFGQLKEMSMKALGFDVSPYHSIGLPSGVPIGDGLRKLSRDVLTKILQRVTLDAAQPFIIQVSTRELMPAETGEALCVNAVPLLTAGLGDEAAWARIRSGLLDIKQEVSRRWGRPRLQIEGSKHLTAAFMVGRVFSPMQLDIRQTSDDYWRSDADDCEDVLKSQTILVEGDAVMTVEVASRFKNIAAGVEFYMQETGLSPKARLQLSPIEEPLDVTNAVCRSMVRQTYREIERAIAKLGEVREIHIFAAAPQAFMMMLGREFKGMPDTVHYEWNGNSYGRACRIPGGVL